MCGPDNSTRPRVGALAALRPAPGIMDCTECDLIFYTPGSPCSLMATHLRMESKNLLSEKDIRVIIHETGELHKTVDQCGLLVDYSLGKQHTLTQDDASEFVLPQPCSLAIGGQGIIGRRVSLMLNDCPVAEGIIGVNC
ncbi:hypothetical protein Cpir12675_000676 [Ceratocystis pirilliformis]|uniref:Uncharacterized protein n=1 Tax=Ceratocystis pirilliformis TaxID=259994 RepID=A0ABR3ZJB5_9PEZI